MHASPIVTGGEAFPVEGKVDGTEIEVAIETDEFPSARRLPQAERAGESATAFTQACGPQGRARCSSPPPRAGACRQKSRTRCGSRRGRTPPHLPWRHDHRRCVSPWLPDRGFREGRACPERD